MKRVSTKSCFVKYHKQFLEIYYKHITFFFYNYIFSSIVQNKKKTF